MNGWITALKAKVWKHRKVTATLICALILAPNVMGTFFGASVEILLERIFIVVEHVFGAIFDSVYRVLERIACLWSFYEERLASRMYNFLTLASWRKGPWSRDRSTSVQNVPQPRGHQLENHAGPSETRQPTMHHDGRYYYSPGEFQESRPPPSSRPWEDSFQNIYIVTLGGLSVYIYKFVYGQGGN
jgi:hypothetical protein